MEDVEFKEEKKKKEEGFFAPMAKWLGKYVVSDSEEGRKNAAKEVSSLWRDSIFFAAAFLSARASSYGGTLPFGLGMICGGERSVFAIIFGVLISVAGKNGNIYFVSAVLVSVLRALISHFLDGRKNALFTESLPLRLAVGAAGGFVCGIHGIFEGNFAKERLFEAVFLIIAVPLASYLYSGLLSKSTSLGARRQIGVFSLYCTVLIGLRTFSFPGIYPALILGIFMTLGTALEGGALRGSCAGMAGGLVCGGTASAIMGIAGAICGYLKRFSIVAAVAGGCGCAVLFSIISHGTGAFYGTIPAILWGGALCLPSVRFGLMGKITLIDTRTEVKEGTYAEALPIKRREESMSSRLSALSEAMSSLSEVFYALSNRLAAPGAWQVRQICEKSFKAYCGSCKNSHICWGRDYERTADALNKLAGAVTRHGNADSSYVPSDFISICPNVLKVISEINLSHARMLESAARQNKTEVFALDYEAMARLLTEATEENSAEHLLDPILTEKAARAAYDLGLGFNSIAVYGKRKHTVVACAEDSEKLDRSSSEIRSSLEDALGIRLTTPEFSSPCGPVIMTVTEARIISCESARASARKKDETVNGDSALVFENREDKYYALISDGMGSGPDASLTSKMTGIFLSKLLGAGNRKHTVLKMLNNFIRNKNLECFATVDLLEIDLLKGEASFIKSGAAASYIVRRGRLFKIASTSLPIGITREMAAEEVKFKLEEGDLIVMVSDGISQSFEDGVWLLQTLSDEIDVNAPLSVISRKILEKAKQKNERSDDMTVIAVRVSE